MPLVALQLALSVVVTPHPRHDRENTIDTVLGVLAILALFAFCYAAIWPVSLAVGLTFQLLHALLRSVGRVPLLRPFLDRVVQAQDELLELLDARLMALLTALPRRRA